MLVLSRKLEESIVLDDNIIIKVLSIKGRQVRFGIDAPRGVSVHREEIYERIKKEGDARDGSPDGGADVEQEPPAA